MSILERNKYQAFIGHCLGIKTPEDFFKLGTIFAELEKNNGCPTAWQVVKEFLK